MGFFKRLFGFESNAERLARELFSPEAARRSAREQQATDKTIQTALNEPSIQQVMRETGLSEEHIRDVHRRLMLHGDPRSAASAIRNPELLRWFAQNGGLGSVHEL